MAIASAAEPGAAGRHGLDWVAIASAAEPGAAGRRSRSSGGYLLDEPPDMTPSFPRTGVSGHAGAVHEPNLVQVEFDDAAMAEAMEEMAEPDDDGEDW